MKRHRIHTAKTETTYLWAESPAALFALLAELIGEIENCPDHYRNLDDLVIGDYETQIPRKINDTWFPLGPAIGESLVYGISYTI